ncbi:mCG147416 [Mus musculus]|nr:mCG147416 [Mus musculus]
MRSRTDPVLCVLIFPLRLKTLYLQLLADNLQSSV